MLQAGIETQLTLHQPNNIPLSHQQSQEGILTYIFFCLHFKLMATGVLNLFEKLCMTQVATILYIYIYIYI